MSGGKDCNKTRISHDYVLGLEKERCKIQVFERELPLCLQLVTKAIETCKQQLPLSGPTCEYNFLSQWEFSDQTISSETEKFNSLKRGVSEKSEWLRSAHLWNQNSYPQEKPKKAAPTSVSSSPETGAGKKRHRKEGETQRKIRRNWSPELHQKFLHALENLGGSHLAAPKQIKELMKEDGLSSDEIKSHLQKYRLHTTKLPPAATTTAVTGGLRRNLGATGVGAATTIA